MPWIEVPDFRPARHVQAKAQENRPWYAIKNAASADQAEVMLYDEIGGWFGATAEDFLAELRDITAPNILLRVNSPGGSVTEGIAIANALRSHPASVTVQIDGIAASIASVIAMAGDRVRAMPNALLMVHDAAGGCVGDAAEMTKMAEVLDLISNNIADVYATKAGGTRDEWRAVMREETWYLPEDALKAGLVDEVVPANAPADDEPAMHAAFDLAVYGYQGPKSPEKPKPGPRKPKAAAAEEPAVSTLTISVADLLDEDAVARLRAAVAAPADVSAGTPGTDPAEATAAGAEPSPPDPAPAAPTAPDVQPEPDGWDAIVARLITPKPTTWAEAISQLTRSTTSSSSATES